MTADEGTVTVFGADPDRDGEFVAAAPVGWSRQARALRPTLGYDNLVYPPSSTASAASATPAREAAAAFGIDPHSTSRSSATRPA